MKEFEFTYFPLDGTRWTLRWTPPPARIAQDQARMMLDVNPSGIYEYYEHRNGQYSKVPDPTARYDTGAVEYYGTPPLKGANSEP